MTIGEFRVVKAIFYSIKEGTLSNREAIKVLVSVTKALITFTEVLELEVKNMELNELIKNLDIK
jgi:hypothetical protein|nr:MAG TPA: hypothetical protein [Caudoviricetes sp.]